MGSIPGREKALHAVKQSSLCTTSSLTQSSEAQEPHTETHTPQLLKPMHSWSPPARRSLHTKNKSALPALKSILAQSNVKSRTAKNNMSKLKKEVLKY